MANKKLVVYDRSGEELYSRPLLYDDNKESIMWLLDHLSDDLAIPTSELKVKIRKEANA